MLETGTIISLDGQKAIIQLHRGDQCDGCHLCHAFGENKMQLEALNSIGAAVGDRVNVSIEPKLVVKSSMILFIFPLVAMLAGYYLALRFVPPFSESVGIVGAFSAFVIAFFIIKLTEKRRSSDDFNPAIVVDYAPEMER
ncbi:SoxR reducing system RseC family protein [candidate division KSB1 bacterium]|nr:SoxR reducing system RseC family protein [candidate division KSB1 bacterium]